MTIGADLVDEVAVLSHMPKAAARRLVILVLDRVHEDLALCEEALDQSNRALSAGVRTAAARIGLAADKIGARHRRAVSGK